jgi:hypothetical protein
VEKNLISTKTPLPFYHMGNEDINIINQPKIIEVSMRQGTEIQQHVGLTSIPFSLLTTVGYI